ncbi:MAG: hypothetical protein K8L97_05430 [Anaerolineae bacterium]|nr:hypothetical protein [Anaerolineae bacterium]
MFKKALVLLIVLLATSLPLMAQEATPEPLPEELTAMFDYDQSAPLVITEASTETQMEDVTVKDIAYPSPVTGDPITAYLVVPPGEGPFPGVLYVHWYEPSSPTSNRTQFLEEAVSLAKTDGVMSLLVSTMWSEPTWYQQGRSLESDYDDAIRQVIELRRGLDVLLAQPNIDAERVMYVGHDFGGMYGSLLAGVDHRAKAYVIIAAASNFNQWMLFGVAEDTAGLAEYKAHMDEIAPTRFIAQAGAPVLFQMGTEDFYTPQDDVDAFFAAAVEPKTLKVYKTEHAMALDEIREDRLSFVREQLGLTKAT